MPFMYGGEQWDASQAPSLREAYSPSGSRIWLERASVTPQVIAGVLSADVRASVSSRRGLRSWSCHWPSRRALQRRSLLTCPVADRRDVGRRCPPSTHDSRALPSFFTDREVPDDGCQTEQKKSRSSGRMPTGSQVIFAPSSVRVPPGIDISRFGGEGCSSGNNDGAARGYRAQRVVVPSLEQGPRLGHANPWSLLRTASSVEY